MRQFSYLALRRRRNVLLAITPPSITIDRRHSDCLSINRDDRLGDRHKIVELIQAFLRTPSAKTRLKPNYLHRDGAKLRQGTGLKLATTPLATASMAKRRHHVQLVEAA